MATDRWMERRAEFRSAATLALEVWARELRSAGFSAGGTGLRGVVAATKDAIELRSDFNGDGDSSDSHEKITYRFDRSKSVLGRATGRGSLQPFLANLADGGVGFRYFDRWGNELQGDLQQSDLDQVRTVEMSLRFSDANSGLAQIDLATTVALRNSGR